MRQSFAVLAALAVMVSAQGEVENTIMTMEDISEPTEMLGEDEDTWSPYPIDNDSGEQHEKSEIEKQIEMIGEKYGKWFTGLMVNLEPR